jgi:maleate isomerase
MSIEYAERGLIGVLTPQSNTTVEPEFWVLLPPRLTALNARVTCESLDMQSRLVHYIEHLDEFCNQFGNAPLNAMVLACTGSSYLVGAQKEEQFLDRISSKLQIPVLTSAICVVKALRAIGANRIGLSSPYPDALNQMSTNYWLDQGFDVVCVSRVDAANEAFHPIYAIGSKEARASMDEFAGYSLDAVVMLGTGMPTLSTILEMNSLDSHPPVLSSMLATVWGTVSTFSPEFSDFSPWLKGHHWKDRFLSFQKY